MSVPAVTVSRMDVGVIVDTAGLEAPGLRETARRILLAEAGKLGVPLGRSEVLRRRARGGSPVHVMAAAARWSGIWAPRRIHSASTARSWSWRARGR